MKSASQFLVEIKILNKEKRELRKQLLAAKRTIAAIKSGNIDALVVAHKRSLKIFTEQTADKTYRILVEKMHEGAVNLDRRGIILYCNSYFASLVGLPLQKVIGTRFMNFVSKPTKMIYAHLFKKGWKEYSQNEIDIITSEGITTSVLMSVNTLSLEDGLVLSIILTNLTLQKKRSDFKSTLIEKIIQVIREMDHSGGENKVKNSVYISTKLNYHYTYLSNIFSEIKGITIQQFIIIQKIEKAKVMLLQTPFSIKEIAYDLEYSNVAHLSNQFKKITGYSPSSYKLKKQHEIQNRFA
ncbi:MAG TPA: helix-turn-helix domain-containing protein [Puia sp.]|nr:helix-turn-helix domain-containing protein [Puia sp.]